MRLFPSGRHIDEPTLYGRWRRALTRAQVRYREPEQLRHTFASTLLSRNAPVLYVAAQGGWRTPGVLFRHYAKWMAQAPVVPLVKPVDPEAESDGVRGPG